MNAPPPRARARQACRLISPRPLAATAALLAATAVAAGVAFWPSATEDPCSPVALPPPLAELPDEHSAGLPEATHLTVVNGDYHTSAYGQVLEKLDIRGRLVVEHDNVKVKCSHIRHGIRNEAEGLQVWLSTLGDAQGVHVGSALGPSDYVARRVEVMGTYDGLKADGDVDVQDSYIHDLYRTRDPKQDSGWTHNDAVQIDQGADVIFRNNRIYTWSFGDGERAGAHVLKSPFGDGQGYMTSAFMIMGKRGPIRDIVIHGNLIRGRSSKYIHIGGDSERVSVTGNTFGTENRDHPQVISGDEGVDHSDNTVLNAASAEVS